jgi:hypothetical protein
MAKQPTSCLAPVRQSLYALSGDEYRTHRWKQTTRGKLRSTICQICQILATTVPMKTHPSKPAFRIRRQRQGCIEPRGGNALAQGMCNLTNLDFAELLLKEGADPNSQDHLGNTPLMWSTPLAHGATKCLLKWPITDVNITTRSRASFLASVRSTITAVADKIALDDNPDQIRHQFLLQQWREIKEMLIERGAHDTGIIMRHPFSALVR